MSGPAPSSLLTMANTKSTRPAMHAQGDVPLLYCMPQRIVEQWCQNLTLARVSPDRPEPSLQHFLQSVVRMQHVLPLTETAWV